jgi:hypothetical protein
MNMRYLRAGLIALTVSGLVVSLSAMAQAQTTITQWNFNSVPPDASTTTGSTTPSVGTGTALLVGTTATFASGAADGGSTDPVTVDDTGWNTSGYPGTNAGSLTEGVQFNVNTVGFSDIILTLDLRLSNTASRFWGLQVSTDGTNFTNVAVSDPRSTAGLWRTDNGEAWFNTLTANLTGVAGVNNNPNFAVRILSSFDPSGSGYVAAETGSTYGTAGTARFDMVTFSGTVAAANVAPEPGTLAFLATGLLGVAGIARRRRAR